MPSSDAGRIRDIVSGLEQPDRYIVLLFFADGLTPREIAGVLEVPLAQVEGAIERFRARAKRVLEPRASRSPARSDAR